MARMITLEKIPIYVREFDPLTGLPKSEKKVVVGFTVVEVDVDELLQKLAGCKDNEDKRKALKDMGYEKYFDTLKKEEGFEWL